MAAASSHCLAAISALTCIHWCETQSQQTALRLLLHPSRTERRSAIARCWGHRIPAAAHQAQQTTRKEGVRRTPCTCRAGQAPLLTQQDHPSAEQQRDAQNVTKRQCGKRAAAYMSRFFRLDTGGTAVHPVVVTADVHAQRVTIRACLWRICFT